MRATLVGPCARATSAGEIRHTRTDDGGLDSSPMAPQIAHAGHWLAQLAYLVPLVVIVGVIVVSRLRDRGD